MQGSPQHTPPLDRPGTRAPDHPLIGADRVQDTQVYNREGEKIGSVEDVAIDKVSGEVAYAIISFGGFLGIGEKYHPVPWRLLTYDTGRRGYVIPCDRDQLEKAPAFDAGDLSGWDDRDTRAAIYAHYGRYGIAPYWM